MISGNSFSTMVNNSKGDGNMRRFGIFHNKVDVLYLRPKQDSVYMKILPAIDPRSIQTLPSGETVWDRNSFLPPRNFEQGVEGEINPWGALILSYPATGHGPLGKNGNRREIVSMKTFRNSDTGEPPWCPVEELTVQASKYPEWKYLFQRPKDPVTGKEDMPIIQRSPSESLVVNAVDVYSRSGAPKTQLAVFSSGLTSKMVKPPEGLFHQRNPNMDSQILQNRPDLAWVLGNFTDPNGGLVFEVKKAHDGKYLINIAFDRNNNIIMYPVTQQLMHDRYNLCDIPSIVPIPSPEETVAQLCELLNLVSPSGVHEYELLKMVFGHSFKIPDPPARGYSMGFAPSPASPQQSQAPVSAPAPQQAPWTQQQAPVSAPAPQQAPWTQQQAPVSAPAPWTSQPQQMSQPAPWAAPAAPQQPQHSAFSQEMTNLGVGQAPSGDGNVPQSLQAIPPPPTGVPATTGASAPIPGDDVTATTKTFLEHLKNQKR